MLILTLLLYRYDDICIHLNIVSLTNTISISSTFGVRPKIYLHCATAFQCYSLLLLFVYDIYITWWFSSRCILVHSRSCLADFSVDRVRWRCIGRFCWFRGCFWLYHRLLWSRHNIYGWGWRTRGVRLGEGMIKMRREEGAIERNRQGKNRDEARLDSRSN